MVKMADTEPRRKEGQQTTPGSPRRGVDDRGSQFSETKVNYNLGYYPTVQDMK